MKKLLFILFMGLFLFGCGSNVKQSEFWQRGSHYKNWEHMKFSWGGYRNPNESAHKNSTEQDWWGLDIPYIPAE